MHLEIVKIIDEEPRISSNVFSKGFGVEHKEVKFLINKYKSEFDEWGIMAIESPKLNIEKRGRGRPSEEYLLNESQAYYLGTLCRNSDKSRIFKKKLVNDFIKAKKLLAKIFAQRQNSEWLEKRASGKIERRIETDTIKEFVEYATAQGSANASKYYVNISIMENKALFALDYLGQKFPNIRDIVDGFALDSLKMADHTVSLALKEGMMEKMCYKEIYKKAKERVELLAFCIGKTPLKSVLEKKENTKSLQ